MYFIARDRGGERARGGIIMAERRRGGYNDIIKGRDRITALILSDARPTSALIIARHTNGEFASEVFLFSCSVDIRR